MILGYVRLILLSGLAALLCSVGCRQEFITYQLAQKESIAGQSPKEQLLAYMQFLRASPFVKMSGTMSGFAVGEKSSFILVIGPDGKLMCRCGNHAFFSDGKHVGAADYSTSPPERFVRPAGADLAGDLYMGVYFARGPALFSFAHLVDEQVWLSQVAGKDDQAIFEERALPDDKVEIRVTRHGDELRFTFAGPQKLPESHAIYTGASSQEPAYLVMFEQITFPKSVQDSTFSLPPSK